MKKHFYSIITVLLATLMIAALPTDAEAEIYKDTLRLHILADSDSEEAQALKLYVRDRLITEFGEKLKEGENLDEALYEVKKQLPEIESRVNLWIKEWGCDDVAHVTLTKEWYDTREYEKFSLPAGVYTSLRVIIGSGEGKNWWCVMYPPLCLDIASEGAPSDDGVIDYTKEELTLIKGGKYNVKFKILETLSKAFQKNG